MPHLHIEWRHLDLDGQTCDRCTDTGSAIRQAIEMLRAGLDTCAVTVDFQEIRLDVQGVPESNTVFINGRPLEDILAATVGMNQCQSCTCLIGQETNCRTLIIDGNVFEGIPPELILKAARSVLGLPD